MKNWLKYLTLSIASLLVFGCDKENRPPEEAGLAKLAKGISSEGDVRQAMGQPDNVRDETDGSHTLEYPKGPEGPRTWMFTIDPSGKLQDYRQVLTEENFARVTNGMSMEEVRRLLGKPRSVVQFKLKNEEVWDWLYLSNHTPRLFNVHFGMASGKVSRTSSSEVNRN